MRSIRLIIVAVVLGFGVTCPARAGDVTFTFESNVNHFVNLPATVASQLEVSPFLFSYTIDTSENATDVGSHGAIYFVAAATLTIDGQTLTTTNGQLDLDDSTSSSGGQSYIVQFGAPTEPTFGTIFGVDISEFKLVFFGMNNTILDGTGIPTNAGFAKLAGSSSFSANNAVQEFESYDVPFTFSVPEPSSLVLAGIAALAGLGVWSRRGSRVLPATSAPQ